MNARTQGVTIAKETLEIIKTGKYLAPGNRPVDIMGEITSSIKKTVLYQEPLPYKSYETILPVIEVVNETTSQAARRLLNSGKQDIVALNFSSARNPGGGFLAGAIAQEEDLCRASTLYGCLKSKPIFYNENILCNNTLYTDNIIYSPNVPFFRDENGKLTEDRFLLSIISAPAPNVRALEEPDEDVLYSTISIRAAKVLQIAYAHGHKNIILGAWGCGAFGNSPEMVSQIFMETLQLIPVFEHVCFAVYDNRENTPVFNAFKDTVK